jgi:hypothetical protein
MLGSPSARLWIGSTPQFSIVVRYTSAPEISNRSEAGFAKSQTASHSEELKEIFEDAHRVASYRDVDFLPYELRRRPQVSPKIKICIISSES